MARATRTATILFAVLGMLALAPSAASAAITGLTAVEIPQSLTVGQTNVPVTITIANENSASDSGSPNTICGFEETFPCSGEGITLQPACGALTGAACTPGHEDLGVFTAAPTATGDGGSVCAGMSFTVSDPDPMTGELRLTPEEAIVLPMSGSACAVTVTLSVVGMPAEDAAETAGKQTNVIASAEQASGSFSTASTGDVSTTISPATPSLTTAASAGITLGAGTLTDAATVSGRAYPIDGATVQFRLFGPDDATCAATPVASTTVPLSAAGTATSPAFTPALAGVYRWVASYSGDANNAAVGGACNDQGESVTVTAPVAPTKATPAITTTAGPGVTVGGHVTATATVSGAVNPVPGATVTFRLYGPDGASCANPVASATAPLVNGATAASPPLTPPQPGIYRWVATYSGDANNNAVASTCGDPHAQVTIAPRPPDILSAGFTSTPRVGQPAFLTIAAFDPDRPVSGVQVQFGEPRALSGISACRLRPFGITVSPVELRLPYTFRRRGKHKVKIIVLSGGCATKQHRTTSTIDVDVAAASSTRASFGAAPATAAGPLAQAAAAGCSNQFLKPATAVGRAKVATAILCLVNVERAKFKLKKLKPSHHLATAALGHSKDMLKRRFFEHAGPGGPSFQARLTRIHYQGSSAAENIGYGSNFNAKLMVQAWMNSPPHRANILDPRSKFAGIGIGNGIPVTPSKPGSTYTMDFGSALK
jgi:uncharacterized protein YkwD